MPPAATAPATGPAGKRMTIENGSGHTLHVHFSGPVSRTVVILDGRSESVELVVGDYQVAAEVPGSTIIPFYGRQAYQPFTHYWLKFYTQRVELPLRAPSLSEPRPEREPRKSATPQFTVTGRIVDEARKPVTNAVVNITEVDDKGEHKIAFVAKEAHGKRVYVLVPGTARTDSDGVFKVVVDRVDIPNHKVTIGLQYVPQIINARPVILRNKDNVPIVVVVDDTTREVDFRDILGDIVLKPAK